MSLREQVKAMDVERMILIPILIFFLFITVVSLFSGAKPDTSSELAGFLHVVYVVLLTAFYVLAVLLLIVRSPATARSVGFAPTAAAYLGTFLPLLFAFAPGSEVPDGVAIFAVVLMTLGMAFSIFSLVALGRSFGVEAKVRTLVQHGPYRYIRNPLYVGEMITVTGAVCFSPSVVRVGILVVIGAVQVYRAIKEEQLLEENVPEYSAYKLRTKRFLPGLF